MQSSDSISLFIFALREEKLYLLEVPNYRISEISRLKQQLKYI